MIAGAKHYAAFAVLAAFAGGCADLRLERFAPPGIVKYENLAKDTPPNPLIVERVKEARAEGGSSYPKLSQQPHEPPAPIPPAERDAELAALTDAREALEGAVTVERALALDERAQGVVLAGDAKKAEQTLDEAAAALAEAVARADAAARRERDLPPRPAAPENQTNNQ